MADRALALALVLPGGDVTELVVAALGLTGVLVLCKTLGALVYAGVAVPAMARAAAAETASASSVIAASPRATSSPAG